jgi:type VI secretion system secreted protein Hcp
LRPDEGVSVAGVDYFLKLDGIVGESVDAKHKGEIELESFGWAEAQLTAPAAGGAGAGKVQMHELHVAMRTSKASPLLFLACATGQHLKSAVLTARHSGADGQEFLVYTLTDVLVSSYETGGSTGDEGPTDQVALSFGRIQVEYRPQRPDGTPDAAVHAGWDVKANEKI